MPWRLIGQQVLVRTCGDVVQIFHTEQVVATHVLHLSGRSTVNARVAGSGIGNPPGQTARIQAAQLRR